MRLDAGVPVAVAGRTADPTSPSSTPTWCTSGTRPERSSTRPHEFSSETASALEKLQSKLGEEQTGSLKLGQAVFLPESVRIADGERASSVDPPSRVRRVVHATSDTLEVQVALDPSQQG